MALQVWLPLNGNLNNQGLTPITFASGTPTYTTGKIGQCLGSGSLSFTVSDNLIANIGATNIYSMCCWCKDLDTTIGARWVIQVGEGSGTSRGLWESNNTATRHWAYNGSGVNMSTSINTIDGNWHHICFTSNGSTVTLYVDGIRQSQITNASTTAMTSNKFFLTANNYNLNDFRLYDHTLSPKEVRLISQGLVLHYPLNRNGFGCDNLAANSYNFSGWSINSLFSVSQIATGEYVASASRTGETNLLWNRIIPTVKLNPELFPNGITVSFDFKCDDISALDHRCICSLQIYNSSNARVGWSEYRNSFTEENYVGSSTLQNGVWKRLSCYFPQSEMKRVSNSAYTVADVSYTMLSFNLVKNGSISFKKIKIEEGTNVTPWIPHSTDALYNAFGINNNVISDVSGYGHNGDIINSITYVSETPRYAVATHFGATNQKIHISNFPTSGFGNSYSFAWWAKRSANSGNMDWGFSDGIRLNGIHTGVLWNTGDSAQNPLYVPGTTTQVTAPSTGVWHHYVMTGDGTTCKVYLDGELWAQAKTYKAISGTSIYINGWDSGTSYCSNDLTMSDFRIYATALSADDVQKLYRSFASVTGNGSLLTYSFSEL